MIKSRKQEHRIQRHKRIRKKIIGTPECLRLCVFRSSKNLYIQLIDDISEKTILSLSTLDKAFKEKKTSGGNKKAAEAMAHILVDKMKKKKIERVVFDRGGYLFHGRVRSLADALRKEGIKF